MKKSFKSWSLTLRRLVGLIFPFLFPSDLAPFASGFPFAPQHASHAGNPGFHFFGRSNGGSRRKKQNRLRLSRKTRNKHR